MLNNPNELAMSDTGITAEDMAAAILYWETYAPEEFRDLPMASDADFDEAILIGGVLYAASQVYKWDAIRAVYVTVKTSVLVPYSKIQETHDVILNALENDAIALNDRLRNGLISIDQWEMEMRRIVKITQINGAVLARGGWGQMSQSDWGWVGSQVKKQYQYLHNFANELKSGKQPMTGSMDYRSRLYQGQGRATFEAMRARLMEGMGWLEYANILGIADHCSGCLEETSKGFVSIGELVPIGSRNCLSNCHCHYKYKRIGLDGLWEYSEGWI